MPPRRSSKRRRITEEEPALPEKHIIFQNWATSQGVVIHPSITPAALPGRGIGLQTNESIPKKTRILFIPEKAIFKPRKEDVDSRHKTSPHAQLALSAFNSFTKDSNLQKWSASWPTETELLASLPIFWPKTLQDKLPPSTRAVLDRQQDDFDADKAATSQVYSEEFHYYWAIVNSRSFHWKPPGSKPGYMVLCPFIDYLNHGPNGTGVEVNQTSKGYEVWTDRDYQASEELLLTYGAHSNDKLLVHYGFMASQSPQGSFPSDDSIQLDHIMLPALSWRARDALQNTGYLGNYVLIPSQGKFCFKTQVAVRAELLSANEWEYFSLNGEDMGADRSKDVGKWLEPLLAEYAEEARTWIGMLKHEDSVAVGLIKTRWEQILEGLAAVKV